MWETIMGPLISLFQWFIRVFVRKLPQQSQDNATNSVQQTQTAGGDAYQAGRDIVIDRRPEDKAKSTLIGDPLEDLQFIDVSTDFLFGIYQDKKYTQIQSDKLAEPYLGKWLKFSGRISEISGITHRIGVRLQEYPNVSLWFDRENWESHLSVLSKGAQINAIGQIEEIEPYHISLDPCALI